MDANSVNGLDDVLRLSESLDEYILLPDAAGGSALGKYLITHGITPFSESVQPYLDYQIIGAEFYADHGGAFCRAGYVVRKEELPEQFLQTEQEQESVMVLRLRAFRGKQQNPISTTLVLPAADELLERTRQRLGIEEFAEAEITMVDYIFPYFATMVPQDCITVESANALAQAIEQMNQTDGELLKYPNDEVLSVIEKRETFYREAERYYGEQGRKIGRGGLGSEDGEYITVSEPGDPTDMHLTISLEPQVIQE